MKKLIVLSVSLIGLMAAKCLAADFVEDSKKRMFSTISVGYLQHFCEKDKVHEGVISLPVGGYGAIGFDSFVRVGAENNEVGLSFPTKVSNWAFVTPLIYGDFTAQDVGLGLTVTLRLR